MNDPEYPLAPVKPEVTHTVIELSPKPRNKSPPPQSNSDVVEGNNSEPICLVTPAYQ